MDASRPLAQLLSIVLRDVLDDLHEQLAAEGFVALRPAVGYALNAISDGGLTAVDLARVLGMTKQGAAKLLDALEADGYVRRLPHPGDGRAKRIELAPRGLRLLDASRRVQQQIEARWAETLGPRPARTLRRQLEQLIETRGALPGLRPPW